MIYFICAQYVNHKMQIMQKRSEYDDKLKFMQQTSWSLSQGDSNVCY